MQSVPGLGLASTSQVLKSLMSREYIYLHANIAGCGEFSVFVSAFYIVSYPQPRFHFLMLIMGIHSSRSAFSSPNLLALCDLARKLDNEGF